QPAVQPAYLPGPTFANQVAGNKSKNYTASFGFDWTITPTLINQFYVGMLYNNTAFAYNAGKSYTTNPAITWNYFSSTGCFFLSFFTSQCRRNSDRAGWTNLRHIDRARPRCRGTICIRPEDGYLSRACWRLQPR